MVYNSKIWTYPNTYHIALHLKIYIYGISTECNVLQQFKKIEAALYMLTQKVTQEIFKVEKANCRSHEKHDLTFLKGKEEEG